MTEAPECSSLRRFSAPAVIVSLCAALLLLALFALVLDRAVPFVQRAAFGAFVVGMTTLFSLQWAGVVTGVFLCVLPLFGNQVTNVGLTAVVLAALLRGHGERARERTARCGDPIQWALV